MDEFEPLEETPEELFNELTIDELRQFSKEASIRTTNVKTGKYKTKDQLVSELLEERVLIGDIGSPVWCLSGFDSIQELFNLLESRYKKRDKLLEYINTLSYDGQRVSKSKNNLKFIEHFSNMFRIDEPCLCEKLIKGIDDNSFYCRIKEAKIESDYQSKVSIISFMNCDDGTGLVMKSIPTKLIPDRYLSLKTNAYDHAKLPNVANLPSEFLSIASNDFVNQTIINMLLNIIFGQHGLNNFVLQYDAFFCDTPGTNNYNGFNIMELADAGDLTDFADKFPQHLDTDGIVKASVFQDILIQLFVPLGILHRDYLFVHSDLKCRNVFVSTDQNTLTGNDFTVKLADYDKCSITWKNIRFYNKGTFVATVPEYILQGEGQDKYYVIEQRYATMGVSYIADVLTGKKIMMEYMAVRHSPHPFYTSYDVYSIFVSMMLEDFFYGIITTNKFVKLWKNLWLDDDYHTIMMRINSLHIGKRKLSPGTKVYKDHVNIMRSMGTVANLLRGLKLKYEVIPDILEYLNVQLPQPLPDVPFQSTNISSVGQVCTTPCEEYKWDSNTKTYINQSGTESVNTWTRHNEIKACQTYPYSKMGLGVFDWDYCT